MYSFQLVLVFSSLTFTLQGQLPTFFKKCKIDDNNCLKDSIENGVAALAEGYEKFGIDKIDPFYLKEIVLQPTSGPISIFQKYSNNICKNFSNLKITSIDINLEPCSIGFKLICPQISFSSDYILKGTFFQFEIDADDKLDATASNTTADTLFKCEKYKKSDEEYLRITESIASVSFKSVIFHLGNVMKGNDVLNKNFNDLLNANPEGFMDVIKEPINYHFGLLSMTVANQIFDQVPVKDLFDNLSALTVGFIFLVGQQLK